MNAHWHIPSQKTKLQISIWWALAVLPMASSACPVCNTETGVQVRQAVFGRNFVRYAAWTLAPVPLLLGGVAAIYYGWPEKRPKGKDRL